MLSVFKTFKARVELEVEKKIKFLRIDNEEEYISDEFDNFINKKVSKGSSQQHILQNKIEWQSK